jgi:Protein of unknown function (DUF2905)
VENVQATGKVLVVLGAVLILAGGALMLFDRIPLLGKLPGDIHITRGNFQLFIPLTSGILISGILSLVLWLVFHFRGK